MVVVVKCELCEYQRSSAVLRNDTVNEHLICEDSCRQFIDSFLTSGNGLHRRRYIKPPVRAGNVLNLRKADNVADW